MSDATIGLEYGENSEKYFTKFGKVWNFPRYVIRKLFLYSIVVNLWVIDVLSEFFGFHFDRAVSEREKWKWRPLKYVKRPYIEWKD